MDIHEFCKLKLQHFYIKLDVEAEPGKLATPRKDSRAVVLGEETPCAWGGPDVLFSAFGGLYSSWVLSWLNPATL